jgi:hypothetical protein
MHSTTTTVPASPPRAGCRRRCRTCADGYRAMSDAAYRPGGSLGLCAKPMSQYTRELFTNSFLGDVVVMAKSRVLCTAVAQRP